MSTALQEARLHTLAILNSNLSTDEKVAVGHTISLVLQTYLGTGAEDVNEQAGSLSADIVVNGLMNPPEQKPRLYIVK